MTRKRGVRQLEDLGQLVLDQKLAQLRAAAAERERSRMQIAALDQAPEPVDLPPVAASLVGLRYQLWADRRRSELNTVLSRQTADWLNAQQDARQAFGRLEALQEVSRRLRKV